MFYCQVNGKPYNVYRKAHYSTFGKHSRGKILIPFLPLIVWICADTLEELFSGKTKFLLLPAVLCFLPAFSRSAWQSLLLVDGAILLIWVFLLRFVRLPEKIRRSVFALILLVPMCVNLGVNSSEKYLKESDTRQKHFTRGDITMFVSDRRYRFDVLANNFVNSNVPADGSIWKTSMYSSITNQLYADFYYNTMRNPISLRNRVVLMPNQNGFFSFFMGTRYVLTREDDIPYGYKRVFRRGGYALAENEQVLPVCYGTYDLLSKEDFDRLTFPETMRFVPNLARFGTFAGPISDTIRHQPRISISDEENQFESFTSVLTKDVPTQLIDQDITTQVAFQCDSMYPPTAFVPMQRYVEAVEPGQHQVPISYRYPPSS